MRAVEAVKFYWTWINKIMAVVCYSVKLVFRRIKYEVTKFFGAGKSDCRCCSEVVVEGLIWL